MPLMKKSPSFCGWRKLIERGLHEGKVLEMGRHVLSLIPFVALICYDVLLLIVIRRDIRSRVYRFFALYLLTMIIWSFGAFMIVAEFAIKDSLFWNRFMVVGSTGMPMAFFTFVRVFLRRKQRIWSYVGLLSYIVIQIANILGYLIKEAHVAGGLLYNEYGPAITITSISWAFFVGYSTLDLVQEYRGAKDALYRNRIKYLLIVVMVIFAGSLTNVTALQVYPVDIAFNAIGALLIAYAIFRHQLLDITIVVRKGLLYSVPTVIIGAGYFLIIFLATRLFHAGTGFQLFLLSFAVALITALFAEPLRNRVQLWVDRLFFREKYDASLMLQRLSRTAASVLDLDRLTNMILDEVTQTAHIGNAAFFLKQEKGEEFRLVAQRGLNLDDDFGIRRDHPVVHWFSGAEYVLTKHDIDVIPQFRALWEQEREDLAKIKAEVLIPLKAKDELVGIFAVGPKLSEEPYSQDDQLTLATLASQVAMAIDNARLYSTAQQELTERKRAEEERERIQAQLLQSQKMEAVGRLAGGVAHDFNNLLTAITSYSDFLLKNLAQQDPRRQDAEEIRKAAERAATLTRQLLAFSRRQIFQPQVLRLNEIVSNIEKMLGRLIGEDIELVTMLDPTLCAVKADPGQIEQVIMNLVVNAHDAMPEGGKLTIRTENVILNEELPKFVCLSVQDTGIGMDEEVRQHLFEPFFTTKEVGKGTGLGLAVAYGIVTQHGGWIQVDSEPGRGSLFRVYLPVSAAEEEETEAAEAISPEELRGSGQRILLVEDEQSVRDAVQRALEENGYIVFAAADATEATDIYDQEKEKLDLLFSDVVLPGKSGLQLTDELLSCSPGLPVLLTSGHADRESHWAVIQKRGFRFLQKPFALADLLRAVKETMEPGLRPAPVAKGHREARIE